MKKLFLAILAGSGLSSVTLLTMESPAKLNKVVPASWQEALNDSLLEAMYENNIYDNNTKDVLQLIEAGASPHARDESGNTPLHYMAPGLDLQIIKALIKAGADVNALNEDGKSPLHSVFYEVITRSFTNNETNLADEAHYNTILKELILAGADVNQQDVSGNTPLHYAADHYDIFDNYPFLVVPTLQTLLDAGADQSIKNNSGKTPLQLALNEISSIAQGHSLEAVNSDKIYRDARIRALVTAVTPTEVQHIIPMLTLLKTEIPQALNIPMPGEIQMLLRDKFIQQLVNQKIALIKQYLPNDSDELLKPLILRNIIAALRRSPGINAADKPEATNVEPMDLTE